MAKAARLTSTFTTLGIVKSRSANSAGRRIGSAKRFSWRTNSASPRAETSTPAACQPARLRCDRTSASKSVLMLKASSAAPQIERPAVGFGRRQQPRHRQRDQRDRHAHPVDRRPVGELDQQPAEHRPDRRGERLAMRKAREPLGPLVPANSEVASAGAQDSASAVPMPWPARAHRNSGQSAPWRRRHSRTRRAAGRGGRSGDGRTGRPACRTPASASRRPARSRSRATARRRAPARSAR